MEAKYAFLTTVLKKFETAFIACAVPELFRKSMSDIGKGSIVNIIQLN